MPLCGIWHVDRPLVKIQYRLNSSKQADGTATGFSLSVKDFGTGGVRSDEWFCTSSPVITDLEKMTTWCMLEKTNTKTKI